MKGVKQMKTKLTVKLISVLVALSVVICCIFGFINGIVISYLQVPAFIGTLGMQLIVYGVCLVYTNATPIGGYHSAYTAVAKGKLFGVIPFLFLIALAVGLVMWFIYNMTPHGKYMYAIGGNEQSAEISGVNTKKTKIIIYMTAAALYGMQEYFRLSGSKLGSSLGKSFTCTAFLKPIASNALFQSKVPFLKAVFQFSGNVLSR